MDLGTNTVSDGEFSGDWNFSGGNLSNVGTLSADSYNGLTLSSGSGTLDLGSYSLVLSGNANLNQHLTTTSSPTFLTLNTGQGDYELYAMDQNVLSSSSPTFSGLTLSGDLALGSNTLTTDNTDLVANLNADLLDGQHGSYYLPKANVSGTDNYLAKFNGTDGLESSVIYESGGNIGIGTESPKGILDMRQNSAANIYLGDNDAAGYGTTQAKLHLGRTVASGFSEYAEIGFNVGYLDIKQMTAAGDIRFFTNSDQKMVIQQGGNVGIGTTNPGDKLTILPSTGQGLTIRESDDGNDAVVLDGFAGGGHLSLMNAGTVNILLRGNGGDSYFSAASGNVGIGTTVPDTLLHLSKTDVGFLTLDRSDVSGGNWEIDVLRVGSADSKLLIKRDSNIRMTIDNTGNVGIGTVGPGAKLDVAKSTAGNTGIFYVTNNNAGGGLNFGASIEFRMGTFTSGATPVQGQIGTLLQNGTDAAFGSDMAFYTSNNAVLSEKMRILRNGNVGIGTTAPAQKLQVAGRIRMDTWTADGDVAVYYNSGTGDIGVTASDERLKTNIETIPNALSIIKNIRGITFNWKDKSMSGDKSIGIIAQEALAVMPELTFPITGPDGKEYLGVHYDKISPILIEAVKEQQEQISNLQLSVSNEFSILNDSMTNLDSRLFGGETSLEDKIAVIGADLTELEDDFKALAGRVQGQEEFFDSLTVTTAGLTESVATLTELYGDHETRIVALENMVAEGLSGGDGVPAELESLKELDSRLVLEDLGADGYRFDIDGNLKVKELEAEKIHAKEAAIEKLQIGKMKQVILESPSGACFKLEINDQGQIESEEVDCQTETEE